MHNCNLNLLENLRNQFLVKRYKCLYLSGCFKLGYKSMYKVRLSPYHKIFYNEWKLDPSSSKYNIVFDQTISEKLDIRRLQSSFNRFITEHVLFNSHITEISGEFYWVSNYRIFQPKYFSYNYNSDDIFAYVAEPFLLDSGPLYRVAIFLNPDHTYRLIFVLHHLLVDGVSLNTFIAEISKYYNSDEYSCLNIADQLIAITETTQILDKQIHDNDLECSKFWGDLLIDVEGIDLRFLNLSQTDESESRKHKPIEFKFDFDKEVAADLIYTTKQYKITPYVYSQCIFAILLNRYTGQEKFAISYPISVINNINFMCGARVNTNFMIYKISKDTTILDLFNQTNTFITALKKSKAAYSYYPVNKIMNTAKSALLDVMFAKTNLRNMGFDFTNAPTLKINNEFSLDIPTKVVFAYEFGEQSIHYSVRCNSPKVEMEILQNFVIHYRKLFIDILGELTNNSVNRLVSEYPILLPEEYKRIVYDWNKTEQDYPHNKTIHQLFEEQVVNTPNKIAIIFEDKQLTYQQLNHIANQLANYLRETYQIKSDDLIALYLNRSEHMLISILGVLKSGAAYVPIAPGIPFERINYILKDTNAKVIITNSKLQLNYYYSTGNYLYSSILTIDNEEFVKVLKKCVTSNPKTKIASNNLAYAIYTSGTTGRPKGVLIEHKNVINYVSYLIKYYQINCNTIGSQYSCFSFDAHVIEIYPILLSGAQLCIIKDEDKLKLNKINDFLLYHKISYTFLPSQIAQSFFLLKNSSLKNLIVGGDKLRTYKKQLYNVTNAYGPTEVTVQANCFLIDHVYNNIPIGKPIANVTNYILDNYLNPLPIGAIGELYIGGDGVSRGYLNNPVLTAEKFIPNHLSSKRDKQISRNTVLYKTGDLVRRLANGNLEYIGRNDTQVKIRGYRVEIDEIEIKLRELGINQILIVAIDDEFRDKYLCAYFIHRENIDVVKLKHELRVCLNDYMIPEHFIKVDSFPTSSAGKIDYHLLPKPYHNSNNYAEPKNSKEQLICEEFTKILGVERVGVNDDFFNMGGNSINAIRLVSNLKVNFNVNIDDIFILRTPRLLADNIHFGSNTLRHMLEKVKHMYQNRNSKIINSKITKQKSLYIKSLVDLQLPTVYSKKNIKGVLLTGATGYLGCNILNQLLINTNYKLFLLIRASSDAEAFIRIKHKFNFYFDKKLDQFIGERILIFKSDITKINLGLSFKKYRDLINMTDSIIHSAALVKHYGEYDSFYLNNVIGTCNLLEFSKLTKLKDFHYISTYSVLNFSNTTDDQKVVYTEYDQPVNAERHSNFYTKTKLQAELQVIKYRNYGVVSNIYRVGNLAFIEKNYKMQENADDNAFSNWLKCILKMKCISDDIDKVEISPVDMSSLAIIKLFDKPKLANSVYHVFNPYLFTISTAFSKKSELKIEKKSTKQFIDCFGRKLINNYDHDLIIRFLLHQGWLDRLDNKDILPIQVLQNRTEYILKSLGFEWKPIPAKVFNKYVESLLGKDGTQFKNLQENYFLGSNMKIKKSRMIEDLERLAPLLPTPIYWTDKNSVVLGVNNQVLLAAGATSYDVMVGKTPFDFYPEKMAKKIILHNNEVMRTGKILSQEETIKDISTGKIKYFNAVKSPLYDDNDAIIGIIGTSIEVTSEKEAEHLKHENRKLESQYKMNKIMLEKEAAESERLRLENKVHKLENEKQKAILEEQERFKKFVGQIVHDIRSPLSSLKGLVSEASGKIPEEERITLRQASLRISDIAQHMLSRYKNESADSEVAEPVLISAAILEVIGEKRYEHKDVNFETDFLPNTDFAFIQVEPSQFKRMLSNLLNNAVEAIENKPDGRIELRLNTNTEWVMITITDNGKGMSEELIDKIKNNISVTKGKKHGSGIGLTQVHDTITRNFGEFEIFSVEGRRTSILIKFPKIAAPYWIAEEIKIAKGDTIVILDDDHSIHGAWDSRLAPSLVKIPDLKVIHFSEGVETINFINALSAKEKSKICLLTDYELLNQNINGLEVIEQTKIKRSTLVTSHYANPQIQKKATNLRVKVLPKELAFVIPIKLDKKVKPGSKMVDIVWVDDARWFIRDWKLKFPDLTIDAYYEPDSFWDNIDQYPLDTKIILDGLYYVGEGTNKTFVGDGFKMAKILHEKGYTNLFLITGDEPPAAKIWGYLTVIFKEDSEKIKEIINI